MAERSSDLIVSTRASDTENPSASKTSALTIWVGLFSAKLFMTALLLRSLFLDCFDPEFQGQMLAFRVAEIGAKLLLVSVAKQFKIERNRTGQVSHIASVAFYVAFEFGKREIVWIECHQTQVLKCSRKH